VTEARTARVAGRVLLVDAGERVLLFRGADPGRPEHTYWFTPGGGLLPGETTAAGAARELREETGLAVSAEALGGPVWRETTDFPFDGVWYRQWQEFFLLRVDGWKVDTAGFNAVERASVDGHRWWTLDELRRTDERVYPRDLATLVRAVLDGEPVPWPAGSVPAGPPVAVRAGGGPLDPPAPGGPVGRGSREQGC
jgi:ADP-ribose pyrophosphatase YjhB (NUDIX family)